MYPTGIVRLKEFHFTVDQPIAGGDYSILIGYYNVKMILKMEQ